jgi:hypothetical protein
MVPSLEASPASCLKSALKFLNQRATSWEEVIYFKENIYPFMGLSESGLENHKRNRRENKSHRKYKMFY